MSVTDISLAVLGYRDAGNAARILDEDEKGVTTIHTSGGDQAPQSVLALKYRPVRARLTALDGNGDPIPGARLYFHETGTSTPKTAYTDGPLTTSAAHPAGRFAPIYLTGEAHKMVLTDAAGVTIATMDPVHGVTGPISTAAAILLDDASPSDMRRTLGAVWPSVADVSVNTTAGVGDGGAIYRVDASDAPRAITPPAAVGGRGFSVAVQKRDSSGNAVGVNPDGFDTIKGAASLTIAADVPGSVARRLGPDRAQQPVPRRLGFG